MQLNAEQIAAIEHFDTSLLIEGGAGTGKTTVIAHKIAYALQNNLVIPESILVFSFSSELIDELKKMVADIVQTTVKKPRFTIVHSFCASILRQHSEELGLTPKFAVYNHEEQLSVLSEILYGMPELDENYQNPKKIQEMIRKLKNDLIDFDVYSKNRKDDIFDAEFNDIYEAYQYHLVKHDAVDLDDLVLLTVKLFKNCPDILTNYRDRPRTGPRLFVLSASYCPSIFLMKLLSHFLERFKTRVCAIAYFS